MLFNSIEFLFFLPIVFLIYWVLYRHGKLQNLFVVVASYVFYGWWNYKFLFLIFFTTFCSFLSGVLIAKFRESNVGLSKVVSIANIVINLLVLGVFKYYNFFVESFVDIMRLAGINMNFTSLNIILPVGISFYTFQALSYSIDVYKGRIGATKDIIAFFAYISFFPQLVAGPIERATNLLPQFLSKRHFDYHVAVDGLRQALWGFFMKVVVADNCAVGVNNIFLEYRNLDSLTLLYGAFLFTIQIYCDFSGYSHIAIGTAKLFGINLMQNFNYPYFSRDISEFWRKWHISLTTWFRDYLYIPMGGSRCGKVKGFRNTVVIFLVSGFWHGASWNYILWGAYHAILFLPLFLRNRNRKYLDTVASGRMLPNMKETMQMTLTFVLVMFGLIIFRAENASMACGYIGRIFSEFSFNLPAYGKSAIVWVIILFVLEWFQRDKPHALAIDGIVRNRWARILIYYVFVLIIVMFQGTTEQFIYFRF